MKKSVAETGFLCEKSVGDYKYLLVILYEVFTVFDI